MDDLRRQRYMTLIEQILCCNRGQEMSILQHNSDLLDAGLLAAMDYYARDLERQGNWDARRVREQESLLAQSLSPEEQFLLEAFQLLIEHQGNLNQVYTIWEQQQAQLNLKLLEVLPQFVTELLIGAPEDQTFIATALANFGSLINQFPSGIHWLNLEIGIAAYQKALQIYNRDVSSEQWALTQFNIGFAYLNRIQGERADNLEAALYAYEQALRVHNRDVFPERWALTQFNIGYVYLNRVQGERADNLEAALYAYEQALQVYRQDDFPERWADIQNDLAIAYMNRILDQRSQNVESAISALQNVLQVNTREAYPTQWAETQNGLANAYRERIHGDRAENIEQAIAFCHSALSVLTHEAQPTQWAGTQNNLAIAYLSRVRGDRAENIEQAIAASKLALRVYTREDFPKDWADTKSNLATAYVARIRGSRADNIEEAITIFRDILKVYTRDAYPIQWADTQNNLASAYRNRIRGNQVENIEQAIPACSNALQVFTQEAFPERWATIQHCLATTYDPYFKPTQTNQTQNVEQAVAAYKNALRVYTSREFPDACRRTSRLLGNLYFNQRNWVSSLEAYASAMESAESLYQSCILLDSQAAELRETDDLPRRIAYAFAQTGQLEQSVLAIEQGRARGLSETLDRDRANLTQLQHTTPQLYKRYQDITNQLRNLESQQRDRMASSDRHSLTPETLRETAIALRQQLDTLIQEIRTIPGYEKFLTLPTFDDVRRAVQCNQPLVYLVPTPAGSLALVVTVEDIQSIWLDNLPESILQEILYGPADAAKLGRWFGAYQDFRDDAKANYLAWCEEIDHSTRQLWEPLIQPLIHHLKAHNFNQATLIPSGYLSFLPLHAAWIEDTTRPTGRRYALDDIHFTYAPNAKSLTAAGAIAAQTQADSILAINNPTQDLPNSEREVQAAIAHFSQHQVLRHREAAIASVREAFQHCNILHLSCHGTANLQEPLTSGLLMSNGLLTLKDILDLNLAESATGGIRLAILSACETGLSGIENPDEAISLPTGLLQAGVAGVIASLWAVSDLSTMLLITKFYDLWREQNLPPDQALRQAQIWLRDTTNEEKIAEFKAFIPTIANTRMSPATAQQLYDELAWETKNERSFAHPFHWAAFNYTGI